MKEQRQLLQALAELIERHSPEEGMQQTVIPLLATIKAVKRTTITPQLYPPGMIFGVQGRKELFLEGKRYAYSPGRHVSFLFPMSIACGVMEASREQPMLAAAIHFDQDRIARMLLKIDMAGQSPSVPDGASASGIFSSHTEAKLLDALRRLMETLDDPTDAAVLGDVILEEIYYHIFTREQEGTLRYHLRRNGEIQQISKAVEYVHQHLNRSVSIEELAKTVNMGSSNFHKKFKEVMHLSPLQYAKTIRLNTAQSLIREGKSVSQAGYMVGYNSPAQFSREYKRYFGVSPSASWQ